MDQKIKNSVWYANLLFVTIFAASISLPLLKWIISKDKKISLIEKRTLLRFPSTKILFKNSFHFIKAFDLYYKDHFGFRDELLYFHNVLKVKLGVSPSKKILLGSKGWLYFTGSEAIDNYRNILPLDTDELIRLKENLEWKYYWLKNKGIPYIFIVAPDKHTIYPEYLPLRIKKEKINSRFNQVIDFMKDSEVPVLDLRPVLLKAKKKYRIYYKSDSHWNRLGANSAQYEISQHLHTHFKEIKPFYVETDKISWKEKKGGDLAIMVGCSNLFTEKVPDISLNRYYTKVNSTDTFITYKASKNKFASKRLLFFGDSFKEALIPFLSHHFALSTYRNGRLDPSLLKKYISMHRPDVVIEEWVERYLNHIRIGVLKRKDDYY